jgi:fatty-acid desaturase
MRKSFSSERQELATARTYTSKRLPYNLTTLNLVTALVMVLFHVGAVAALFFFSWTNLLVAVVLHWFAVGFGISLGYHRLHTHRGYKTSRRSSTSSLFAER